MPLQRTPTSQDELPRKGQLLPELWLPTPDGVEHTIAAYRGRRTCIVIAAGDRAAYFVEQLSALASEFAADEIAVVVAVAANALDVRQFARPGLILTADPDLKAHARLAGTARDGKLPWGAYVTDQFGEIYFAARELEGDSPPSGSDLLGWARYVNVRCEECFPPEWPA